MPSTYAHYTFGERMLPLFPAKIRALIQENRALYDIGLHGPDILFYYKALCSNEVNAVGYEMHDKPGADFFAPAKEIWQQFRTDGASCAQHTAYLLGFLCHYALDQCCHGYVEKMMAVSGLSHAEIETEFDEVENEIRIELKGTEMGMLIGKRGQTLDSLQYLTSLVANKNKDTYTKIKIDTENYRQRRKETIENLARNVASKVKKTGRPAFLEPMNPYERRIIHAELQADKYVDTHSEGEEPHRKVVITLNREFASELPRRNNYRRRNSNYSRDRKRPYQEKKD